MKRFQNSSKQDMRVTTLFFFPFSSFFVVVIFHFFFCLLTFIDPSLYTYQLYIADVCIRYVLHRKDLVSWYNLCPIHLLYLGMKYVIRHRSFSDQSPVTYVRVTDHSMSCQTVTQQVLYTIECHKNALSAQADKRHILEDDN